MQYQIMQHQMRKLKWSIIGFIILLLIPAIVIFSDAVSRLKWETVYQNANLSKDLTQRINSELQQRIKVEELRPFSDYRFLIASGDTQQNYLQQSPLAAFPVKPSIPGLLGYFQVDGNGGYSSPLLPTQNSVALGYGVSVENLRQRQERVESIYRILSENKLASGNTSTQSLVLARKKLSGQLGNRETMVPDAATQFSSQPYTQSKYEEQAGGSIAESAFDIAEQPDDYTVEGEMTSFDEIVQAPPLDVPSEFSVLKKRAPKSSKEESALLGKVQEIELEKNVQRIRLEEREHKIAADNQSKRMKRKEQNLLLSPAPSQRGSYNSNGDTSPPTSNRADIKVALFENEVEPFEFSLLDSGHFILYRQVWHEGKRFFQGSIIDQTKFLESMILSPYRMSSISLVSNLIIGYQDSVLQAISAGSRNRYVSNRSELKGTLLHEARLISPMEDFSLIYSVAEISVWDKSKPLLLTGAIFTLVLVFGGFLFYRLGVRQFKLSAQQQDFVSSVSHELKTPLTSIRMYGEILKAGWASEEKKQEYYAFIFDESERLSRLINNILQLAKMNRGELDVNPTTVSVGELLDLVKSRVLDSCIASGFELNFPQCSIEEGSLKFDDLNINVDKDAFIQVMINLIDNSIKFGKAADRKQIDIEPLLTHNKLTISVRDYGPGISSKHLKKIFELFYRAENEMTRQTSGTGIGLALVHQLVNSMGGRIRVENVNPGVLFSMTFVSS